MSKTQTETEVTEVPASTMASTSHTTSREGKRSSYKPGDIIQDHCKPFMKVLLLSLKGKRCDNCFAAKRKLNICTGCKRMHYCNRKCQVEDWKNAHQFECGLKAFKTYSGPNAEVVFNLFRMWATLKNSSNAEKPYTLYDGSVRTFNNLPSHASKYIVKPDLIEEGRKLVAELSQEDPSVTLELFVNYYGILQTNEFQIFNEDETASLGIGIYIEPSFFKHSCKPRALYWFNGTEMQIRAIGRIHRGEKPTISYMFTCADREERRRVIRERYFFECNCIMCEERLDVMQNYRIINELLKTFENVEVEDESISWPNMLNLHSMLIKMLESIYYEYDERVTNQFKRITEIGQSQLDKIIKSGLLPYFINDISRDVSLLIQETERRLSITYGVRHSDYKEFMKGLSPDMRKLFVRNKRK